MFLKAGIEYKGRNQFNETILFVSACGNNSTLTEILIEGGCDLNECTRSWTALHVAAARNHDEVLRVLVKHGCDLNIRDRDGNQHLSIIHSLSLFSIFCRFQRVDVGDPEWKSQECQTSRSMRLFDQFRRVVLNAMSSKTVGEVSCHWTNAVEWTNTSEEPQRTVSSSHTSVSGTTNMAKNSTTAAAHSAERLRRIERDLRGLWRSTAAASKLHSIVSYQYWRTSVLIVVGRLVIVACCQCFEMFSLSISRTFSQFDLNRFRYVFSGTTETKSTDLDDRVGDVGQRTCSIHRCRSCRLQYSCHHLSIHTLANSNLWIDSGRIHYRLWISS